MRLFKFGTGKLFRKYDESLTVLSEMQQVRRMPLGHPGPPPPPPLAAVPAHGSLTR